MQPITFCFHFCRVIIYFYQAFALFSSYQMNIIIESLKHSVYKLLKTIFV